MPTLYLKKKVCQVKSKNLLCPLDFFPYWWGLWCCGTCSTKSIFNLFACKNLEHDLYQEASNEASLESSESELSIIFSSASKLPASEIVCILSLSASSLRKKENQETFYLSMCNCVFNPILVVRQQRNSNGLLAFIASLHLQWEQCLC